MRLYELLKPFVVDEISFGSILKIACANALVIVLGFLLTHVVFRSFCGRRRIQHTPRVLRDYGRELLFSVSTLLVGGLIGVFTLHLVVTGNASISTGPIDIGRLVGQVTGYFLAFDFYLYTTHYFLHRPLVLRWVHEVHHRSRSTSPLTAFSIHPIEAMANGLFIPVSLLVADLHVLAVMIVTTEVQLHTVLLHCGCEPFPRWWRAAGAMGWLATPTYHDAHHARGEGFGFYLTIWDHLFGTDPRP